MARFKVRTRLGGNNVEISSPNRSFTFRPNGSENNNATISTTPDVVQRNTSIDSQIGAALERREAAEQEAVEETIEEREEVLEESGGSSAETEELGDDPKEEIQEVKKSLKVLYSFNPAYTAAGFIESLNPDFRKIQVQSNASQEAREEIRKTRSQAKLVARDSILLAKVELKSGRARIDDYKSMSRIDEPVLDLEQRRFIYKPAEKGKLRTILSRQPFDTTSITDKINSFLEVPEFERIEAPVIINKFEIENQFRLSPIDDAPTQIEVQSDNRRPPRIGSFLRKLSPDRGEVMGVRTNMNLSFERTRPSTGGGGGGAIRRDIDTGLIEEFSGDRTFERIDARTEDPFESDRVDDRMNSGPATRGGGY